MKKNYKELGFENKKEYNALIKQAKYNLTIPSEIKTFKNWQKKDNTKLNLEKLLFKFFIDDAKINIEKCIIDNIPITFELYFKKYKDIGNFLSEKYIPPIFWGHVKIDSVPEFIITDNYDGFGYWAKGLPGYGVVFVPFTKDFFMEFEIFQEDYED